jgi:hypothetical protein
MVAVWAVALFSSNPLCFLPLADWLGREQSATAHRRFSTVVARPLPARPGSPEPHTLLVV